MQEGEIARKGLLFAVGRWLAEWQLLAVGGLKFLQERKRFCCVMGGYLWRAVACGGRWLAVGGCLRGAVVCVERFKIFAGEKTVLLCYGRLYVWDCCLCGTVVCVGRLFVWGGCLRWAVVCVGQLFAVGGLKFLQGRKRFCCVMGCCMIL